MKMFQKKLMKRNVSGQILPQAHPRTPILPKNQGLQILEEEVPIKPKMDEESMEIPPRNAGRSGFNASTGNQGSGQSTLVYLECPIKCK